MNLRASSSEADYRESDKERSYWKSYEDLLYHERLLDLGFIVVKPNDDSEERFTFASENSFVVKNRKFQIGADVSDNPALAETFNSFYPKQAAEVFSQIPALNPYREWQIYLSDSIAAIDPTRFKDKTIILTPTRKNKGEDKSDDKPNFRTAYFIKKGKFVTQSPGLLSADISLLGCNVQDKKLIPEKLFIDQEAIRQNPTLLPYEGWHIVLADRIEQVNPSQLPEKTVILIHKKKNIPNQADKTNFKTYFVAQGKFLLEPAKPLTSDVNLLSLTREERSLIVEPRIQVTSSEIKKNENNSTPVLPFGTYKKLASDEAKEVEKAVALQIAKKILTNENISPWDLFIHNEERRSEFFVPVPSIGLYVSASTTPNNPDDNSKQRDELESIEANNFVTAVCMFGPGLKGIDDKGNEFILVKHDKQFYDGQKISFITYNDAAAKPYEKMLWSELEKQLLLIKKLANPNKPINLKVHLPYIDYMLFVIELFFRGRIELKALGSSFKSILKKRDQYIQQINEICKKHNVIPQIESPFENLLSGLNVHTLLNYNSEQLAKTILGVFEIPTNEIDPETIPETQQKENEKKFVKSILERLKAQPIEPHVNTANTKTIEEVAQEDRRRQVWRDILETIDKKVIFDATDLVLKRIEFLQEKEKQLKKTIQETITKHQLNSNEAAKENGENTQLLLNQLKNLMDGLDVIQSNIQFHSSVLPSIASNCSLELLEKLKTLIFAPTPHAQQAEAKMWDDLIKFYQKHQIITLEDLFKLANATELAITCYGTKRNGTVSMLPLTENRIPIEFHILQQERKQMEYRAWQFVTKFLKEYGITCNETLGKYLFLKNNFDQEKYLVLVNFLNNNIPANVSHDLVIACFDKLVMEAKEWQKQFIADQSTDTTIVINTKLRRSLASNNNKGFQFTSLYNPILNLTYLDPVITYMPTHKPHIQTSKKQKHDHKKNDKTAHPPKTGCNVSNCNQGQVFYFTSSSSSLNDLLREKLNTAYNNLSMFCSKARDLLIGEEVKKEFSPTIGKTASP